jgi:uncharacterized protein
MGISCVTGLRSSLLIDTSAFVALLDRNDDLHAAAADFYKRLPSSTPRVTTHAVVAECYTFFRYKSGRQTSVRWLDYLDEARASGLLHILYSDESDGGRAERLLRRFADQHLSYVDSLTLAAAERYCITTLFGFDRHLALTGLALLPRLRLV